MKVKVSGMPTLTISGSTYSADVPVALYDDNGWQGEQTSLNVTGNLTDTGAQFLTKLTTASNAWQAALAIHDTFQNKLANLVGRVL